MRISYEFGPRVLHKMTAKENSSHNYIHTHFIKRQKVSKRPCQYEDISDMALVDDVFTLNKPASFKYSP